MADTLDCTGSERRLKIFGRGGNDTLTGGDRKDIINGGGGLDIRFGDIGLNKFKNCEPILPPP